MITPVILALAALVAGIIIGLVLANSQKRKELSYMQEKLDTRQREYDLIFADKESLRNALATYQEKALKAESAMEVLQGTEIKYHELQKQYLEGEKGLVALKTQLYQANQSLEEQKKALQSMLEQNRIEFRNMATDILEQKEKAFSQTNDEQMTQLLTPLREQLTDFKKKVEEVYGNESKERHTLEAEIRRLVDTSNKVGQEANNLTNALKTNVKKQGNWGELLLETILSGSGMQKGREFVLQEFIRDDAGNIIKDDEGKGLQPDAMIFYPDDRKIIADSKVSLIAWERYVNADDPEEQKIALAEHIGSMYSHIDGLSAKKYPKYAKALDYVLMFVPIEPAFLEALKVERELWKYAYEKGIVMVSPTNTLAVLKIIADLWKVEKQSKHAIEIAEKAGSLHDKFVLFAENLLDVGKKLDDSQKSYTAAMKQLNGGSGNIVKRILELKKMGAKASKQLPDQLLKIEEDAEEQDAVE